jgi:hypothetical protein
LANKRLTSKSVENARGNADRRTETAYGDGLYLVIQPSGAKSWAFRYRRPVDGRPAKLTLGSYRQLRDGETEPADRPAVGEPMTLAHARWWAAQVKLDVAVQEDPSSKHRQTKRATAEANDRDQFEVVAARFLERYARRRTKASTFGETVNVLGFRMTDRMELELRDKAKGPRPADTWPALRWKGRLIQSISRRDVNELLDAIIDADAPYASNSTFSAIRRLFNWAVEQDVIEKSPCDGVKRRFATADRDRVLTDAELRLVWLGADKLGWPFGHLVKSLMLTAARRDEWAEGRWTEVNLGGLMFQLPGERTKNGLPHDIPLVPKTVEVLEDLATHRLNGSPDWLFSTGRGRGTAANDAHLVPISGFSKAKKSLDAAIKEIAEKEAAEEGWNDPQSVAPWRLHDLRRTAVTGMARLGVSLPVIEKAVNHISGSFAGVAGVYQRYNFAEEVRDAFERWALGLERVISGSDLVSRNVVDITVGRAAS